MNDARMTIRLPADELAFAKAYAKNHGLTLTGLVHHYFDTLARTEQGGDIPAEVTEIAGTVPPDLDARDQYYAAALRKHSCDTP
jgi:hypothetical protein